MIWHHNPHPTSQFELVHYEARLNAAGGPRLVLNCNLAVNEEFLPVLAYYRWHHFRADGVLVAHGMTPVLDGDAVMAAASMVGFKTRHARDRRLP